MKQYGARLAKAIDQADNADDIIRLLTQYADDGDTVLTAIYNYGDDAIRLIDNYGDEATTQFRIGKTLDEIEEVLGGGSGTKLRNGYEFGKLSVDSDEIQRKALEAAGDKLESVNKLDSFGFSNVNDTESFWKSIPKIYLS